MNHFENPMRLIKELKGAGWAIYSILRIMGIPLGEAYLAHNSGYSRNSIRDALDYMQNKGLVRRSERYHGWALTGDTEQLPLGNWDIAEGENPMPDAGSSKFELPGQTPEIREAQILSIEGQIEHQSENKIKEIQSSDAGSSNFEHRGSNFELPDHLASLESLTRLEPLTSKNLARSEKDEIAKIMDDAGIREPARTNIMAFTDITAKWVREHIGNAETIPLAVYRMEHHWNPKNCKPLKPAPALLIPADPRSCDKNAVPDEPEPKEVLQQGGEVLPANTESIPGTHFTPESLWVQVLGQLQIDMPKASFETWVKPARPEGWEGETLVLMAVNPYGAEWLRSRLASTIDRLLVGLTNGILKRVEIKTE